MTVAPAHAVAIALGVPAHAVARAGILVQAAVAVRVHKIQAPVLGVEIIATELALVAVGIALVVRVFI